MYKRLSILAIAAGAMLLTACGENGSTTDVRNAAANVDSIASSGDEPVDCGEVAITDTISQSLIADPTTAGIVGCTEAFNVLDEYLTIPAEDRGLDNTALTGGWSCGTDDGEVMSIGCVNDYELAFHTQPADTPEPVDCGEVAITGTITHTLIADPTPTGVVGCTEAFNILDEYLTIPAEDRGLDNTTLTGGWSCGTDDGEVMSIGCVKGKVGDNFEFAFHTMPV